MASTKVTVIGTGSIGSAVARALLGAGHRVAVWNRTPSRTAELVEAGATTAASVPDAVRSSELVLATLTDYAAVLEVLRAAADELAGRTLVVLTTGSPEDARLAASEAARMGADYLDAGVQTGPDDIGTDRASFLYSGPAEVFERHRDVLERLGGMRYVGDAPEAAALWDHLLFGVWYDAQLGLLRALAAGHQHGLDLDELAAAAATQLGHVVAAAMPMAHELRDGRYPRGPASLSEHLPVVERLEQLRKGSPLGTGGLEEVRLRLEDQIAAGHGDRGLTDLAGA